MLLPRPPPASSPRGPRKEAEVEPTMCPEFLGEEHGTSTRMTLIEGVVCAAQQAGCGEASSLAGVEITGKSDNAGKGG